MKMNILYVYVTYSTSPSPTTIILPSKMNELRAFLSLSQTLCPQLKKVDDNTYCVINSLPLSSKLTHNCLLWKMELGLLDNFSWSSIIKNVKQILQEERVCFLFLWCLWGVSCSTCSSCMASC